MATDYRKEFFDREYGGREAYGRVWKYARKYKMRLFIGILSGMLTAGTLLPFFQVIQPALSKMEERAVAAAGLEKELADAEASAGAAAERQTAAKTEPRAKKSRLERQMQDAAKLPSWYPKAAKVAEKFGIKLEKDDGGIGGALVLLCVIVVPLVAGVRLLLIFLNQYCLAWAGIRTVTDLRRDVLDRVQSQSMQFFGRVDVGQLMSRCINDPLQIQTIIQVILSEVARAPFEILVSVGFIVWFSIANDMLPTLLMIFIGMPAFMLPVAFFAKSVRKWSKRSMEKGSVLGSKMHELLTCIRVIKAYNTEDCENEKYAVVNANLNKALLRTLRIGLMVAPTVETVGIALICAFVMWCYFGNISLSQVVPMIAPLLLIYKPLKQVLKLQMQIETGRAALARIWSILDVDMRLEERADAIAEPEFKDKIAFENVSFRYDTADRDAVRGASFEIPRGKMVAVVGGTGSGKSTMSGLLARFFDPREGRVTLDGVDLRDLKISGLRRLVGSVMQETILFNESIEENIKYGSPDATHDEVVAAAKMANAHEFIMSQPEGYGRIVGEKGFALSGGERQRIAIARAILRNPPILILDEATSALDTVTERLVQDALTKLMANRTVFAIAHRLSTIRDADLILVMKDGEIVERGTHDELYALGGAYRRLCDMQSRG